MKHFITPKYSYRNSFSEGFEPLYSTTLEANLDRIEATIYTISISKPNDPENVFRFRALEVARETIMCILKEKPELINLYRDRIHELAPLAFPIDDENYIADNGYGSKKQKIPSWFFIAGFLLFASSAFTTYNIKCGIENNNPEPPIIKYN
jgi:hypothetical protein